MNTLLGKELISTFTFCDQIFILKLALKYSLDIDYGLSNPLIDQPQRPSMSSHIQTVDRNIEPKIFDYLDYRSFIKDRLEWLSSQNSKYSQRWLAKRMNLKSAGLLSMIIKGERNLSREKAAAMSQGLGLNGEDCEYFNLLCELGNTKEDETRKDILEKIRIGFQDGLFKQLNNEGFEAMKFWYIPAIREMVRIRCFKADPSWISYCLGITEKEAQHGWSFLVEKEFVKEESNRWVRSDPSIHNLRKIPLAIIHQFQLAMIQKAINAVSLPTEQRLFETLTFSIPRELQPKIESAIKRFCRELDFLAESHLQADEVFQLNVQLFSLSNLYKKEG